MPAANPRPGAKDMSTEAVTSATPATSFATATTPAPTGDDRPQPPSEAESEPLVTPNVDVANEVKKEKRCELKVPSICPLPIPTARLLAVSLEHLLSTIQPQLFHSRTFLYTSRYTSTPAVEVVTPSAPFVPPHTHP